MKIFCCSVEFGTLVGVLVFSVMWSELLKTSAISCSLWSSVYECYKVECAFTSPVRTECGMFVICCMQCCMSVSDCSTLMCCLEEVYIFIYIYIYIYIYINCFIYDNGRIR